jgi:hypothetical protein
MANQNQEGQKESLFNVVQELEDPIEDARRNTRPAATRGLLKKLAKNHSEEDFVSDAVCKLKNPEDIRGFYTDYIEYIKENGKDYAARENAEEIALNNICYALRKTDHKTAYSWMNILSEFDNPIFERSIYPKNFRIEIKKE